VEEAWQLLCLAEDMLEVELKFSLLLLELEVSLLEQVAWELS
jgi:hypothetical protein